LPLTGSLKRRKLLIASMAAFAVANLVAAMAPLGFSLGASVGAFAMVRTSATNLGWIGAPASCSPSRYSA
jgi:predicted MFS family arabinose efflux permease